LKIHQKLKENEKNSTSSILIWSLRICLPLKKMQRKIQIQNGNRDYGEIAKSTAMA